MNRIRLLATLLLAAALAALPALAQDVPLVIKGYDPVAYFTEGKPVKGDGRYSFDFDGGRYHFASARHRDMFAADPWRFAPQFGGYCTGSMSRNVQNEPDPDSFVIQDGKLYFFGDKKFKPMAEKDPTFIPTRVPNATKNWEQRKRG
jgi:YHS domain-containing protein